MKKQRRMWGFIGGLACLLLIGAYVAWALLRPLPAVYPAQAVITRSITPHTADLSWPTAGQAAVGLADSNRVISHGAQTPAPTASTAKVITALVVLQKKPLNPGQSGPTVTLTPDDVARYIAYAAQQGSTLPVKPGEQISEYQMLEAIMLPSANNIADTMAIWAFGSLPAYAAAANSFLAQHGIVHSHVGSDASGLSPDTTTTAEDLVTIGKLAMANPVLAQVVSQSTASGLPLVDTVKNVNFLLGNSGIVGIKTGNSDQAGGVFLGAAKITVNGKPVTVISAVVGAPDLGTALAASLPLIQSAEHSFTTTQVYAPGQVVNTYTSPWGATSQAVSRHALAATSWYDEPISSSTKLASIKAGAAHTTAGSVTINSGLQSTSQSLALNKPLAPPSWQWRILHPLP